MSLNLILASQSPRRRELLQLLPVGFQVQIANVDEDSIAVVDPKRNVIETARLKATKIVQQAALRSTASQTTVLAADTTVAFNQEMLNKPGTRQEARHMLQKLRGKQHEVHTGMVLLEPASGRFWEGVSTAVVTMRPYTDGEIDAYIASGDPFDKAGGYAIQHPGFRPVAHLQGCYCNVMGLPLCDLIRALAQFCPLTFAAEQINFEAVAQAHQHYPCPSLATLRS